jgi:hypothetical protein
VTICGKDPTRPRYRVKARYAGPGGSAMEGTSGAADLEPLRGGPGEAALDPRRSAKAGRGVTWSRSSLAFTCEGHGSRGVIVGGIPCQLVSDSFRGGGSRHPRCTGLSLRCAPIMRQEVSERIGLGRSSRHGPALKSGGTSARPRLARRRRQTGGVGWRKPAGPWPVRPRLVVRDVPEGASAPAGACPGRKARTDVGQPSPGSGGRHGGWLQPHPEGFLPVQRKLGAPRRRARTGDRSILWLCSWIVLVAEVDERHLVQAAPPTGNRRGKRWV